MTKKPIGILLTDTHLKPTNIELVESIFDQACDLALEMTPKNGVPRIFHAGDWFTNRIGQNLQTLLALYRIIKKCEKKGVMVYGISGNHDKTFQDSPDSYLDVYSNNKLFTVFREEELCIIEGLAIGFLPFFTASYLERLAKLNKEAKKHKNRVLITHHAFNGVRNNDGSEVADGIPKKSVKIWDAVYVGHYHDASIIGKNIHYIGSTYQGNYGENSEDKGFQILYNDGSIEFEASKFPKYIKVSVDVDSDIQNEIEAYSGTTDNVRFIFKGKRDSFHKVDQSALSELGIECKFEITDINEEILKAEAGDFTSFDKKSVTKLFLEYCKIQEIEPKMRNKGLKILMTDEIS